MVLLNGLRWQKIRRLKMFKDWTKFEKTLLFTSVVLVALVP